MTFYDFSSREQALLSGCVPLFITLEGGEGAGKSSQVALLEARLRQAGLDCVRTREPGGCVAAEMLRKLLVEGDADRWDGLSELLLYSAARNEHLRTVVRPSLAAGKWVVSDRFADSSTVYQGLGRGVDREDVLTVHNIVVQDLWPHLTIVLDLDPTEGLNRQGELVLAGVHEENRFESIGLAFHQRVREGFLRLVAENPQRCKLVDASGNLEDVAERVWAAVMDCVVGHQMVDAALGGATALHEGKVSAHGGA